jgi:hypothetical protein
LTRKADAMTMDTAPDWATGPEPKVTPDGRLVYRPDRGTFPLTVKQGLAFLALWRAVRVEGRPYATTLELMKASDSMTGRMATLYQDSAAWGTLILPFPGLGGTYTLPVLPKREPAPETTQEAPLPAVASLVNSVAAGSDPEALAALADVLEGLAKLTRLLARRAQP